MESDYSKRDSVGSVTPNELADWLELDRAYIGRVVRLAKLLDLFQVNDDSTIPQRVAERIVDGKIYFPHRGEREATAAELRLEVRASECWQEAESILYSLFRNTHAQDPSSEDELVLLRRAREGDEYAASTIAVDNIGLTAHFADIYARTFGLEKEDLIMDGYLTLRETAIKFREERGIPFAGFASFRLKQAVKYILRHKKIITEPPNFWKKIRRIQGTRFAARKYHGMKATTQTVAKQVGMKYSTVVGLEAIKRIHHFDVDHPASIKADDIEDPFYQDDIDWVHTKIDAEAAKEEFAKLSERKQHILTKRLGLDRSKPQTLEQVSADLGITRERVRQLQQEALKTLKNKLEETKLDQTTTQ